MSIKKIIFIPPNGEFKKQDFSLQRILKYFVNKSDIKTTLIYIESPILDIDVTLYDDLIRVESKDEIIDILKDMEYDVVFHRSWMGAYEFAAELVFKAKNVIINIKDWNFASKDVYEFLYPEIKDYESIEYIFKHSKKVLSHFTQEQAKIWAKEYKVDEEIFDFFPEYCNEEEFNNKPNIKYKDIHLVYAGALQPTVKPEDYFPGKAHLRSIKLLTTQGIKIDFVLPPHVYDFTIKSTQLYKDFLYEDKINDRFRLLRGEALNASILNKYHFGFFELETTGLNHMLYKYAITSKFAFYLESALPMFVNKKFNSIANLVYRYKLGIVFSNEDLKCVDTLLDISDDEYQNFVYNIKKFRKEFTYKSNAHIIEDILKHE